MCVLECFSRFVMCTNVKDGLISESLPFKYVSRNVVSFSEISAVNLIVGWKLLACSINRIISCLSVSQSEKMSSM